MKDLITDNLTKEDVTALILQAKKRKGLTWEAIAEAISMAPVWTHSAAMGMNAFPVPKAREMMALLDLPEEALEALTESPTKIWDQTVPTDPCIYRLYEMSASMGRP